MLAKVHLSESQCLRRRAVTVLKATESVPLHVAQVGKDLCQG